MFGKGLSFLAAIGFINCFYMPWYAFPGVENDTPLKVFNYFLTQPMSLDTVYNLAIMGGIILLGILMILTSILPRLYLSLVKLAIAIGLCFVHITYFFNLIQKTYQNQPWDLLQILSTSQGFLIFLVCMIIYFITVVFAIILSPIKGAAKLVGL